MRWIVRSSRAFLAAAVFSMLLAPAALAQGVTTGAITGTVTDSSGARLEGARVVAVHGPSGTTYSAVTRADGRFTMPGMRVGGPYRVSASRVGYRFGSPGRGRPGRAENRAGENKVRLT